MKTVEVDKIIEKLEWEKRRGHYSTDERMALLSELKAMKQALNIDIVIEWLPIDEMSDEDWDRAYEEDLMIKFDNGAEGRYSSCWGSAEATHVAV
jgi:hypothetical protein